jgi:two-component sensor histidine kinase
MARFISFKAPGILLPVLLSLFILPAAGRPWSPPLQSGQHPNIPLHFEMLEDTTGLRTASVLYHQPWAFAPLHTGWQGDPTSYYWLRTTFHASTPANRGNVLSFSHLTYVDVYLFSDSGLVVHKAAGAFRPRSEIADGDGRLFTILPVQAGKDYTLLIQVHHTKHYQPVFDFQLQPRRQFSQALRTRESFDAALMGAVVLLLIYSMLSWAVSRYRAYAWLGLFTAGIGLYVFSSGGYWIEWFSPEDPATGWLLNVHFLHAGMLGLYLLVVEAWRIKTGFPRLHAWIRWTPWLLAVTTITTFCIDYWTGNYNLSVIINCAEHPLMLGFVIAALYTCWPHLSAAQRFLAYGLALCGAAGMLITVNVLLNHERSLTTTTVIGDCIVLAVVLLFSTGLKEEMRSHEVAKQAALEELSRLQLLQNTILEKKVAERTGELAISNKRLLKQKQLLAERNTKIEILINELNHRVKNNLQLLYSLLSLQLPIVKDSASREILKGNISKIRAMMLVNQKLFNFDQGDGISLCEFIGELAAHLQKIYDTREQTRILQDIPPGLRLSDRQTLSFGLIMSELLTNTFKHAFLDHPDPCIRVQATALNDNTLRVIYSDNGIGISGNDAAEEKFTMGIPLIRDLTRQMKGQLSVSAKGGLSYCFTIPV